MQSAPTPDALKEYEHQVQRDYKHNFIVNAMDGASYWFGYSFISPTIILPLYISHFTSNPLIFSLIPFLNTAGFMVPQLFTANFVERSARKKFFPVNMGFFLERMPIFMLTVTAALFAKNQPSLALALFLICFIWYTAGAGTVIVGWNDMIAKIIPVDKRGRFFGITNFVGNTSGILGALAVPILLTEGHYPFPNGFVMAFSVASVLIFMSWVFLALTKEPPLMLNKPHVSQRQYLRSLPQVLHNDSNFLHYLIFQIIFNISGMANGFLIVYSSKTWHLTDSQASGYVIAMQIGQSLATLFFGFLADRKGHKLGLEMCALISAVSFGMSFLAPSPLWFYPVFFLRGVTQGINVISGTTIVMEFSSPEDRPTYIGLANTIPGIAGCISPLIGGWLAGITSYPVTFALSAVIGLAGYIVMHWMVREPRHQKPGVLSGEIVQP